MSHLLIEVPESHLPFTMTYSQLMSNPEMEATRLGSNATLCALPVTCFVGGTQNSFLTKVAQNSTDLVVFTSSVGTVSFGVQCLAQNLWLKNRTGSTQVLCYSYI